MYWTIRNYRIKNINKIMIREDIKQKLINEDLDKLFLPHRDGIDQANYRVGDINNEIIAWNPDTDIFMDYFYDDYPDIIWFELSLINKDLNGYFLNRNGEVKGPRKKLKQLYSMWKYPMYNFRNKDFYIHRIISLMFIPNYYIDTKIYVDHIDRNKDNYFIGNLRWTTIKENNGNRKPVVKFSNERLIFRAYEDKLLTKIAFELIGEKSVIDKYSNNKYAISSLRASIRENTSYHGYYWGIKDLDMTDYLVSIGLKSIKDIDESKWVEHYLGGFYVHPLGLIKTKRNKITIGSLCGGEDSPHKERKYHLNSNTGLRVHRLVAEVFLNNNQPIKSGLVIDHINTNSLDNRVENLRICSQVENMNNVNTINKLKENALRNNSRKIISPSGKIYNSIKDCAKDNNMSESMLWRRLNGRRPDWGFRYYEENDQDNNNNS